MRVRVNCAHVGDSSSRMMRVLHSRSKLQLRAASVRDAVAHSDCSNEALFVRFRSISVNGRATLSRSTLPHRERELKRGSAALQTAFIEKNPEPRDGCAAACRVPDGAASEQRNTGCTSAGMSCAPPQSSGVCSERRRGGSPCCLPHL